MPSRKLLATVLVAVLTLTACATWTRPVPDLPPPLPPAYVAPPPEPPERSGNTPDDMAVDLKRMYDLYGQVAGQLVDLIKWVSDERPH